MHIRYIIDHKLLIDRKCSNTDARQNVYCANPYVVTFQIAQ